MKIAAVLVAVALVAPVLLLSADAGAQGPAAAPKYPKLEWKNGAWADANFFPLSVWMQPPSRAKKYKECGINIYMNLWKGPTEKQLAELAEAGMAVMVELNDVAYKHKDDPAIVGWQQVDEPDILHSNANGWPELVARKEWSTTIGQYQPAYNPADIQAHYRLLKAIDPARPVYVGLSLCVVYGDSGSRGNRKNHPEDFPEYMKGGDIVGYDIYPGLRQEPRAAAKYWTVAKGVMNLVKWGEGKKVIWPSIEFAAPYADHMPRTAKAEVWMAIVHGSMGINYWVHQNSSGRKPIPSVEDSVFLDGNMTKVFVETNRLLTSLAPVLNSPTVEGGATVASSVPATQEVADAGIAPIAIMVKKHAGATYVFSVRMEDTPAKGTFEVKGLPPKATAEVIGENRKLDVAGGKFADDFQGMEVHIYRITAGT